MSVQPELDISVVVRSHDDEEYVGHVLRRVTEHLRSSQVSFELIVADENSGDNTIAIVKLLCQTLPEVHVLHCDADTGYRDGARAAKGRYVMLYDVRTEAPLSALSYAMTRLQSSVDIMSVGGRYILFRRARAIRAQDALLGSGSLRKVERSFVRRCKHLGLVCVNTQQETNFLSLTAWKKAAKACARKLRHFRLKDAAL